MRARFGEWPEKLQPTVTNHRSELWLKREGNIQLSGSPKVVPRNGEGCRFSPHPRTISSETLKLGPVKLCVY